MFQALTEFLILPYSSAQGMGLLDRLTRELGSDRWNKFWGAVAFANASGNDARLLGALAQFAERGGTISLTFGADLFGSDGYGTDSDAVEALLSMLHSYENARIFLYHERGRTFHPKIYVFAGEQEALVIVGSSNWTRGGLSENVEANVVVQLSLLDEGNRAAFDDLVRVIEEYWTDEE